ncbi:MAG: hypothetical protein CO141_01775 [Candidatus Moranbacteria bacterium CG_4_9_14_3_um_filter_42_9]|nr:MAG: hypothetical protein CO141_01775 [Candidatus Moranbacteria bacterium CG_4_9_14_3_um_filter_42_9]
MISSTFFGSKAYPYFFCPPEKVTKKALSVLMRWKILHSFAKSSVFVRRGGLRYKLSKRSLA